jgi:hypothetical protein
MNVLNRKVFPKKENLVEDGIFVGMEDDFLEIKAFFLE